MKTTTQKTAAASPKPRRKSETLTLDRDSALALDRALTRFLLEENRNGDERHVRFTRRWLARKMFTLACEAVLDHEGSIIDAAAWWKLSLGYMDAEEIAAKRALIDATIAAKKSKREGGENA